MHSHALGAPSVRHRGWSKLKVSLFRRMRMHFGPKADVDIYARFI
jgi:hypothetical protein